MTVKLDINDDDAVRLFSEQLAKANEQVSLEIGDAGLCPNRIVPIVALSDRFRRGGGHLALTSPAGSASETAIFGLVSGKLTPETEIERPFGRVWRFDNGLENCSSGFVDELLGKLVERYGFVAFSQRISFINVQGIVGLLINHSIAQRMAGQIGL